MDSIPQDEHSDESRILPTILVVSGALTTFHGIVMSYSKWMVIALLTIVVVGCNKKQSAPLFRSQSGMDAPVPKSGIGDKAAPVAGELSAMKGLEVLISHSNAYIRNNALEAKTQWNSRNYLPAATAFQTILGLLRSSDEQAVFFSSFEPFQREVRAAAQAQNPSAKEAVKFLEQTAFAR